MKLSFALIPSLFGVALASTTAVTTASLMHDVMNDFARLGNNFARTFDLINVFPQNGIEVAAELHNQELRIQDLLVGLNTSLTVIPKSVSTANVKAMIDAFERSVPIFVKSVDQVTAKVADFTALGLAPFNLMQEDLIKTDYFCGCLTEQLKSITPLAMLGPLSTSVDEGSAAGKAAIAAFGGTPWAMDMDISTTA